MKLELNPETLITVRNKRTGQAATPIKLGDLVRKNYRVETSTDGVLWDVEATLDNSTEANASAEFHRTEGKQTRIVIAEYTDKPKNDFWNLYRTAWGKRALKEAGIFVQKRGDEFYISGSKASRSFWKTGGYRSFDSMDSREMGCYDAALKDAIRDGDGAGSESEKANLRELRENFGLAPSAKYLPGEQDAEEKREMEMEMAFA